MPRPRQSLPRGTSRLIGATAFSVVALATAAPAASADHMFDHAWADNQGRTLVIGDSHTWLAGAGRQYPNWDTDSESGRTSAEGIAVLDRRLRRRHKQVVFDLATNDCSEGATLAANLRRVWHLIGRRQLLLVTAYRLRAPKACDEVNAAIRDFTDAHPRRSKRARAGRVLRRNPSYFGPDGVHLTAAGYERRTEIVAGTAKRQKAERRARRGSPAPDRGTEAAA